MKYKTIDTQGFEFIDIDNDLLGGKSEKFNGAFIEFKGELLLAYRSYSEKDGKMKVFISKLDRDFFFVDISFKPVELTLYSKYGSQYFEDPRLFVHKDKLHCSYVNVIPNNRGGWATVITVARLNDDLSLDHIIWSRNIGNNLKGTEKNWIYFSHNGGLYLIYDQSCNHVFKINENTGKVIAEYHQSERVQLINGYVRGGTSVLPYNGKYLVFYHGSDHMAWLGRTYYLGVLEFDAKEPFKITRASHPIYFGSNNNGYCGSGSDKCAFPAGIIDNGDYVCISMGINDTYNTVMKVGKDFIEENLKPISEMTKINTKYFKIQGGMIRNERYKLLKKSGINGCTGILKVDSHESYMQLKASKSSQELTYDEYLELLNQ
jgi:predicted GH43/DUF377 family glycosyl hydrolase